MPRKPPRAIPALDNIDGGNVVSMLPLDIEVVNPAAITITDVVPGGEPPKAVFRLRNNRSLPANWQLGFEPEGAALMEVGQVDLEPDVAKSVEAGIRVPSRQDAPSWLVARDEKGGELIRKALPMLEYRIHRLKSPLTLDGDLGEWPAAAFVPDWAVDTSGSQEIGGRLGFAWDERGVYVAVESRGSRRFAPDPRQFWVDDVLELLIDTNADKTARSDGYTPGDHQLWICPQFDSGSVYAGRWKRGKEIPATQYGIEGVKGVTRVTDDGYIMELFIPASAIAGARMEPETAIGLSFCLSVAGASGSGEVYWPRSKSSGLINQPENWATGILDSSN